MKLVGMWHSERPFTDISELFGHANDDGGPVFPLFLAGRRLAA